MEKITVLMAVFNTDSEELKQSVSSILNQTYKNFDFLIIDDGSNLETKTLLNSIKKMRSQSSHSHQFQEYWPNQFPQLRIKTF